ncbi:MAG TPA: porin [Spirochaetia bacterium]|nr:porin [Spirochaetia bacterium]
MKALRFLIPVVLLIAAVGFTAGADAPAIGQPGSLLEPYGLIDAALRASTNADPSGDIYFGASQGLFNGSRWGLRGTEDLGGGFKAIYALEGGVILPVGVIDQQGQLFGRQAWVGLKSDYGTLTFGRQYGTFSDAIGAGDVFGTGHGNLGNGSATNYSSSDGVNFFFAQQMGFRWDNSLKYDGSFSGVAVGVMAATENIPGGSVTTDGFIDKNAMISGKLGYNSKDLPVSGAVGVQYEADATYNHHIALGGGLKYALDATDAVYLFYIHSEFDAGFVRISPNNSEISTGGKGRKDDIVNLAANYYVMPSLNVIASFYFDYGTYVFQNSDDGQRYSGLLVADYYLSKDFDVYLGGWYTQFIDSFLQTADGGNQFKGYSSVFSVIMGTRFRF